MMKEDVAAATPFVRGPAACSTLNILGITHFYKATGAETAGSFSLWEAVVPLSTGVPPHTHDREDEAFYVLRGEHRAPIAGVIFALLPSRKRHLR
jgi:uncharacterized cupin superfamily protein